MPEKPNYPTHSDRTTGDDRAAGADPGGTRSTKPSQRDKRAPQERDPQVEQTVSSGDRNPYRESRSGIPSKQ
ncbi:MAG TPA: hypothetical protein VE690_12465 [Rhodopila sp.]|nr:hypothetical protein [Rhodopila sp.]